MIGLGEILVGLNILEKLGKFLNWLRGKKPTPVEKETALNESVTSRFVRLFESHGVHRNQIPRFIGHGLTLKDVQNDASLLDRLDETLLGAACARFAVRREWMDGADSQAHPTHDFYKQPKKFSDFIGNLLANNAGGGITGVLIASKDRDWQTYALLLLQETVGDIGDKTIYRYHLCNNWSFSYWKARAYLTACVAEAWRQNIYVYGIYLPKKEIDRLAEGNVLLGWQGEGIHKLGHKTWNPEDMALLPEEFLKGIKPESDNYGIKSGLALWLDLEQQGLMDTGIRVATPRQQFQQELAKYSPRGH